MKILIIVLIIGLTGCKDSRHAGTSTNTVQLASIEGAPQSTLIKYEDKEEGIICYRAYGREGISCLKK